MGKRIRKGAAVGLCTPEPPHVDIAGELSNLNDLDLDALRSRWLKVTGRPAPRGFRSELLRRALTHETQVATWGGPAHRSKAALA
jgi:hypothetical protein